MPLPAQQALILKLTGLPLITRLAVASGLSFVYSVPASTTDDVEFSMNNGSDFNYSPTPDSDGFDSLVSDVRINPKGTFNPSNGTDIPAFTVSFSVRVD